MVATVIIIIAHCKNHCYFCAILLLHIFNYVLLYDVCIREFLSMSGLLHLGDTEPSTTPTDLVFTNEQLLRATKFAQTAFDRLKGYSITEWLPEHFYQ